MEPQPLHNGMVCVTQDFSRLSTWIIKGDGNGLLMVPYARLLYIGSNTLYVLHIHVQAALDGYGASTTA